MRIIADHIRTATFLLGDERGIVPSNVDQGFSALLRFLNMFFLRGFIALYIHAETFFFAYLHRHLYGESVGIVKPAISRDIPVVCMEMPIEEAREKNAVGVFGSRYGEIVRDV